jgi:glycine oxidase
MHELLREAYRLLPDVAEMELVDALAGLRPGTPDNLPLIGAAPEGGAFLTHRGGNAPRGLIWATGHYRNGILLAPLTAEAVADLLEGADLPESVAAADPSRLLDRAQPKPSAERALGAAR